MGFFYRSAAIRISVPCCIIVVGFFPDVDGTQNRSDMFIGEDLTLGPVPTERPVLHQNDSGYFGDYIMEVVGYEDVPVPDCAIFLRIFLKLCSACRSRLFVAHRGKCFRVVDECPADEEAPCLPEEIPVIGRFFR